MHTSLRSLPLLSLAALLAACPPVSPPTPLEPAARVTAFTASQTLVNAGDTVTLTWATEGATEVRLDEATLGQVSGVEGTSGSVTVAIAKNALFVLTARNARGVAQRAVVGVSVRESLGDALLTATPTEIDVGQPVTLAWSAPGATELSLVANPGGALDTGGQLATGSVTVSPAQTTIFTLTAGTRTAAVTVTVRPTLLSFTSSTAALEPTDGGASVTLSWTTANAGRVQLVAPGRAALVDSTDAGVVTAGSYTDVLPAPIDGSRLFVYELRVEGAGTTVSRSLTLPVRGAPAITALTAPRFAKAGGQVVVSWTTTGADSLSLYDGDVELHRTADAASAAAGSVTLNAGATNLSLEAVARSARAGEARQRVDVEVVGNPTITLATVPATVARGAPFQLSWAGTSVRRLTLYDDDGRVLHHEPDTSDTGTAPMTLVAGDAQTFRVVADNTLGDRVAASLTVQPTGAFTFTPSPAGAVRDGQRVSLAWSGGETLYGFPHDEVTVRSSSTGFDDISTTGTRLTFASTDDDVASIVTPFRAPFFGRTVGEVITVSTNGYLSFGPIDKTNYVEVALPNAKMEPNSIVAYWDDLSLASGTVHWQVKPAGSDEVLIVQWTNASSNTFQLKLSSTGQIDLEYQSMTTTVGMAGVQGPRATEGYPLGTTIATGRGVTFFAPKTSPVTFTPRGRQPARGFLRMGTAYVPVAARIDLVHAEDLQLGEALIEPPAAVGPPGRWLEFFNARATPIDLTGWTLDLPDGGVSPLSGVVPAGGVRVFGLTTDRALNDDAGVDVALTGFDVSGNRDSFTWGRGGALGSLSWNNPTTGFSQVTDYGPYRFVGDATATPARAQTCVPSAAYGSQQPRQRGTPGTDVSCGFGYRWERLSAGYFDISEHGSKVVANVTTSGLQVNVDLSAAPFSFAGTPRSAVRLSTDGYLTFDLAAANNTFTSNTPATSAPNSVLAIFADDLGGRFVDSGVFVLRAGAGEDPFATAPHWIFQWHRWSHATDDDLNFQVKLFDDGTIEYHFGTMVSGSTTTPWSSGVSANTWVENPGGTQALVINAQSITPGISPFTAYRFSPR